MYVSKSVNAMHACKRVIPTYWRKKQNKNMGQESQRAVRRGIRTISTLPLSVRKVWSVSSALGL